MATITTTTTRGSPANKRSGASQRSEQSERRLAARDGEQETKQEEEADEGEEVEQEDDNEEEEEEEDLEETETQMDLKGDTPLETSRDRPQIFAGHKFYLARTMCAERRAEIRLLIRQHGGVVVEHVTSGSVEIVERVALCAGKHWVSADFIEHSSRDGAIKNITKYMASEPPARSTRKKYTAQDDARMLTFLQTMHPSYYGHTTPLSIWQGATAMRITEHSGQSMHEHYRKVLLKLTDGERQNIIDNAAAETSEASARVAVAAEGDDEETTQPRVTPTRTATRRGRASEIGGAGNDGQDDETGERARKRAKPATPEQTMTSGNTRNQSRVAVADADEEELTQTPERPAADTARQSRSRHSMGSESRPIDAEQVTAPAAVDDHSTDSDELEETQQPDADEDEEGQVDRRDGEPESDQFPGFWNRATVAVSYHDEMARMFSPAIANEANRSPSRAQRRKRMSLPPIPTSTQTSPRAVRNVRPSRSRRASTSSLPISLRTPDERPPRQSLTPAQQLVSPAVTPPPPPRRRSLDGSTIASSVPVSAIAADVPEEKAEEMINRLQYQTMHDLNAIHSALYWCSGDANVALTFLMGKHPAGVWSARDDALLLNYMNPDVTAATIDAAKRSRAFRGMSINRTVDDILRRIRFLL